MTEKLCRICNHPTSKHHSHIGPDWTGQKIKHIGCIVVIKTDYIEDFLGEGNTMPIGHTCSCHGFKPNTDLKRAIKKYQKYLKEHEDLSEYRVKELKDVIRRFRKDIKDNPENLLHWQRREISS
jgi:hypothetical protein